MPRKFEPVIGTTYRVGFQATQVEKHCWRCMTKTHLEMVGRGDTTGGGLVKLPICKEHAMEVIEERGLDMQERLEKALADVVFES